MYAMPKKRHPQSQQVAKRPVHTHTLDEKDVPSGTKDLAQFYEIVCKNFRIIFCCLQSEFAIVCASFLATNSLRA